MLGSGSVETRKHDRLQPKRSTFTPEEDCTIIDFVRANGARNWNLVANELRPHTPKQCRERWHNHLDPEIRTGPWLPEEDEILARQQAILGSQWAKIARFLPGRTDTLVKNRWNSSVKDRVVVDLCGGVRIAPTKKRERGPTQMLEPMPQARKCPDNINHGNLQEMWIGGIPPLIPRDRRA
jgi:hypothetical protein